jgi:hypothetical protein
MNPRGVGLLVRAGSALLGAMWLIAALSKATDPASAYEFAARVVGGGTAAKALLAATAAGEALLGTVMLLGALQGFVPTLAALAAATASLVHVKSSFGGAVKCGCLALLADSSVDQAIRRNGWIAALTVALLVLDRVSRRRRAPGAAAASGPATDAP